MCDNIRHTDVRPKFKIEEVLTKQLKLYHTSLNNSINKGEIQMTFLQLLVMIFITYVCVYSILNRICKCLEVCSMNRAVNKFLSNKEKQDGKKAKAEAGAKEARA